MGNTVKIFGKLILILFFNLFVFCKPQTQVQGKLDIWENIQASVFKRDLNYLLNISSDTLYCLECNEGQSKVTKEKFFNNYIEQIDFLKDKEYSTFIDEVSVDHGSYKRYRMNYRQKNGNIICTVLEGNGKIIFEGCYSVP